MEHLLGQVGICKDPCNRRYGRVSVRKLLGLPAEGEVGAGCDAETGQDGGQSGTVT